MNSDNPHRGDALVDADSAALRHLARTYGIEPSYRDVEGRTTTTADESLLAVVRSLGASIERRRDAGEALRLRRRELAARLAPPVAAVWRGRPARVRLGWLTPGGEKAHEPAGRLECELTLESGETLEWTVPAQALDWARRRLDDGELGWRAELPLQPDLPVGYHRLRIEGTTGGADTFVICAPLCSHPLAVGGRGPGSHPWGVHAPLYSIRGTNDRGMGDLEALAELVEWAGKKGASVLGLLPVLATFADDPSPYAPASRLFWNEMLLASGVAGGVDSPAAALASSDAETVDYPTVWAERRRALQRAADELFAAPGAGLDDLKEFAQAHPAAETYSRFRAACDRHGNDWAAWPERLRKGEISDQDHAPEDYRYHLYGQYRCARDWPDLAARAQRSGVAVYMDLPLGVPGRSFDAWWRRELFAPGVAIGAPPDPFFESGQNWGLRPVLADACRADGYGYLRAVVEHHMSVAGVLRIDHVMGMHRQYWIPDGFDATDGAYVRSRPDELWALLVLESRRHGCALIGEDLGTVPAAVRAAMDRHAVLRTYVLQSDLPANFGAAPPPPPLQSLACLNTHDMPPFGSFWAAGDVDLMERLGRLEEDEAAALREHRARVRAATVEFLNGNELLDGGEQPGAGERPVGADPADGVAADVGRLARGCLQYLADGPARLVMVDLNDLWGETRQQNVPGTYDEHPNWRARSRYAVRELDGVVGLAEALEKIDAGRRRARSESKEG